MNGLVQRVAPRYERSLLDVRLRQQNPELALSPSGRYTVDTDSGSLHHDTLQQPLFYTIQSQNLLVMTHRGVESFAQRFEDVKDALERQRKGERIGIAIVGTLCSVFISGAAGATPSGIITAGASTVGVLSGMADDVGIDPFGTLVSIKAFTGLVDEIQKFRSDPPLAELKMWVERRTNRPPLACGDDSFDCATQDLRQRWDYVEQRDKQHPCQERFGCMNIPTTLYLFIKRPNVPRKDIIIDINFFQTWLDLIDTLTRSRNAKG